MTSPPEGVSTPLDPAASGAHPTSAARLRLQQAEERRRPLPGLPEPDAWSTRWILAASIALLVGAALPQPDLLDIMVNGGDWADPSYLWPWALPATWSVPWYEVWARFAWALLGFTSLVLRGVWRAGLLVIGSVGLVIVDVLVPRGSELPAATGARLGDSYAVAIVASLGLIAVVVGNHLRKRSPMSRGYAGVTGVGGILGLLALLLPCESFVYRPTMRGSAGPHMGALVEFLFTGEEWIQAWPLLAMGLLAALLAVIGVRSFSMRHVGRRCAHLSVFARVLLMGQVLATFAMTGVGFTRLRWLPSEARAAIAFRSASFCEGAVILLATGVALALEARRTRRADLPWDSRDAGCRRPLEE